MSRPIWSALVGDRRGARWTRSRRRSQPTREDPAHRVRAAWSSLDDAAQTITLSDALGAEPHDDQGRSGARSRSRAPSRVVLEAPLIQHGQGATHPAVFGDQLLTYLNQLVTMFNAHVHPGELAGGHHAGHAGAAGAAVPAADARASSRPRTSWSRTMADDAHSRRRPVSDFGENSMAAAIEAALNDLLVDDGRPRCRPTTRRRRATGGGMFVAIAPRRRSSTSRRTRTRSRIVTTSAPHDETTTWTTSHRRSDVHDDRAAPPRLPVPPRRRAAARRPTAEDDHVRDMIYQVLFTNPGERVNRPDFGCGLKHARLHAQQRGARRRHAGCSSRARSRSGSSARSRSSEVEVEADRERLVVTVAYRRRTDERAARRALRERAMSELVDPAPAPTSERRADVIAPPPARRRRRRPERDRLRRGRRRRPPHPARHLPQAGARRRRTGSPRPASADHDRRRHAHRRHPRRSRPCVAAARRLRRRGRPWPATSRPTCSRSERRRARSGPAQRIAFSFMADLPDRLRLPRRSTPARRRRSPSRCSTTWPRTTRASGGCCSTCCRSSTRDWTERNPSDLGIALRRAARLRGRPALVLPGRRRQRGLPRHAAAAHLGPPPRPARRLPHARRPQRLGAACTSRSTPPRRSCSRAARRCSRSCRRRCQGRPRRPARCCPPASITVDGARPRTPTLAPVRRRSRPRTTSALHRDNNELRIHTWGNEECCLAPGVDARPTSTRSPAGRRRRVRPALERGRLPAARGGRRPAHRRARRRRPGAPRRSSASRRSPSSTDPLYARHARRRRAPDPPDRRSLPLPLLRVRWRRAGRAALPALPLARRLGRRHARPQRLGRARQHRARRPRPDVRARSSARTALTVDGRLQLTARPLTMQARPEQVAYDANGRLLTDRTELDADVRDAQPAVALLVTDAGRRRSVGRRCPTCSTARRSTAHFVAEVDDDGRGDPALRRRRVRRAR